MIFNINRSKSIQRIGGGRFHLPLMPLRDIVVFPHMVVPLFVGREKSINALEHSMNLEKSIFLSSQKDAKIDEPSEKDIHAVGTIGTVLQLLRLPDGTVKALVEGKGRGRIINYLPNPDFFYVEIEPIAEPADQPSMVEALKRVEPRVRIVVRLDGTNAEEGRRILRESGLNFTVADGMKDAAEKVVSPASQA